MTQRVAGLAGDAWKPRQRTSEGKYVAATPERAAGTRKALGAIIDAGLKFVNEVAPFLCEPAVLDPAFQARFKAQMLDALVFAGLVGKFGANDSKFVGLTHTNLQLDNAYFWTTDDAVLSGAESGDLSELFAAVGPIVAENGVQECENLYAAIKADENAVGDDEPRGRGRGRGRVLEATPPRHTAS